MKEGDMVMKFIIAIFSIIVVVRVVSAVIVLMLARCVLDPIQEVEERGVKLTVSVMWTLQKEVHGICSISHLSCSDSN